VEIVDGGETADGIFVVTRLVPGISLRQLLVASPNQRPPDRVITIILDVLAGLGAAQRAASGDSERQLFISDLSPESVLVGLDGRSRLLDYGLATPGDPVVRGKAAYLAPEQILRGQADQRSNLFSIGILMFNALTGTELFQAETLRESLHLVCTKPLQLPSSLGLKPPPELNAVCARALEREPERRFASAIEMTRELSKVVDRTQLNATHTAVAEWVKSLVYSQDA
jgi:serine/threonine-protein kinase